jgi:hypothetical protein
MIPLTSALVSVTTTSSRRTTHTPTNKTPPKGTGLQFGNWLDAAEGALGEAKDALRGGYRRLEGAAGQSPQV